MQGAARSLPKLRTRIKKYLCHKSRQIKPKSAWVNPLGLSPLCPPAPGTGLATGLSLLIQSFIHSFNRCGLSTPVCQTLV